MYFISNLPTIAKDTKSTKMWQHIFDKNLRNPTCKINKIFFFDLNKK